MTMYLWKYVYTCFCYRKQKTETLDFNKSDLSYHSQWRVQTHTHTHRVTATHVIQGNSWRNSSSSLWELWVFQNHPLT